MRMLKESPAIGNDIRPQCDAYGYALDQAGACAYRTTYAERRQPDDNALSQAKICLCAMMYSYQVWTCGHTVSRLKETTHRLPDGTFQLLTTEQVFRDYTHNSDQRIQLPPRSAGRLSTQAV